jgi:hypothetical protein
MTEMQSPSRTLSEAIVAGALELAASEVDGALHEHLLATTAVSSALARTIGQSDLKSQRELLCRLAVFLAREVLSVWSASYPGERAPAKAVVAAEAWVGCPSPAHADAAAEAARLAADQALAVWRHPPKEAAWAGRAAAWAAAAPKYGWQSVAAIIAACRATDSDRIVVAADRFFETQAACSKNSSLDR